MGTKIKKQVQVPMYLPHKVECFVRWKGRSDNKNSWEEGSMISYERIREFGGARGGDRLGG